MTPSSAPRAADSVPRPTAARRIASAELFVDRNEVIIVHGGREYRLRVTRADKLILTK